MADSICRDCGHEYDWRRELTEEPPCPRCAVKSLTVHRNVPMKSWMRSCNKGKARSKQSGVFQ